MNKNHAYVKWEKNSRERKRGGNRFASKLLRLCTLSPPFRPLATYIKIDISPFPPQKTWGVRFVHILIISTCWWSFVFSGMKGCVFGGVQMNGWKVRECVFRSNVVTDARNFNISVLSWYGTQMVNKSRHLVSQKKTVCSWEYIKVSKNNIFSDLKLFWGWGVRRSRSQKIRTDWALGSEERGILIHRKVCIHLQLKSLNVLKE